MPINQGGTNQQMGYLSQDTDSTPSQVDRPIRVGASLPATSRVGELYFLVSSATKQLYACFVANSWSVIGAYTGNPIRAESPSGTIDGANKTFTLAHAPSPASSLILFLNGEFMVQGTDYTLSSVTITMDDGSIPVANDLLTAYYAY